MYVSKKRTKGKLNSDIKSGDLYNYYIKNIKPVESLAGGLTYGSYKITKKEHSDLLKDINVAITDIIITENFEFKIPCGLGFLSMKQKKVEYKLDEEGNLRTRNLSIDFKATRDLWSNDEKALENKTVLYHTNEHTDGNRMKFEWSKYKSHCFGIKVYYFHPCRRMKRSPAAYLKNKDLNLGFYQGETKTDRNLLIYNNKNKV